MAEPAIDNLPKDAKASEMEEAIVSHINKQTDPMKHSPVKKDVTEAIEEVSRSSGQVVEKQVVEKEEKEEKEVTEPPEPVETKPEIVPKEDPPKGQGQPDPEQLQKNYDELRKWNTRLSQEVSDIKKKESSREATEPKPQELTREQLLEMRANDPIEYDKFIISQTVGPVLQGLTKRVDSQDVRSNTSAAQNAVERLKGTYSDFKTYEEEIKESIQSMPQELLRNPDNFEPVLNTLYLAARGKRVDEFREKAREEGRQEALKKSKEKTQDKKDAYVEGSGRSNPEEPIDRSQMNSKEILAEMKARGISVE